MNIENIIKEGNKCKANMYLIGPTGPRGESFVSGYGEKYDTTSEVINLQENTSVVVPLSNTSALLNVTSGTDSLIINDTGVYKVDYYISGTSSADATLTFSINQNDNALTSTDLIKEFKTNNSSTLNGSAILSLDANDRISLILESSATVQFTPSDGVNAYLSIIKI